MVKFGILGSGDITACHFFAIDRLPGVQVAAIASADEASGRAAAEKYGARYYADYKDLLAQEKDLDGLVNALPNHMHFESCMAAIDAGQKCILCEKPLGINAEQSAQLVKKVEESGVFFETAYMKRFNPGFRKIKELLPTLGEIEFINACIFNGDAEPEVTAAQPPQSWHGDAALSGGGFLTHSGSHHLDLLRYLFGEVDSVACKCRYEKDSGKDYYLDARLGMAAGYDVTMRLGRVDVPNLGPGWQLFRGGWNESIEVIATRGYVRVDNPSWQGYEAMRITTWLQGMSGPATEHVECNEQWVNEFAAFIESCKTHKLSPSGSSVVDGYRVDYLIERMRQSGAENGAPLAVEYKF